MEPVYVAYDLSGNRTLMQDEWGATYWTYDLFGRPTSRKDPRGTVVTYAYGARGERTELTVDGQGTVYYEYGPTGSMDLVLDGKTGLRTYYEYDPASRVRYQHHPNATATYFVYDLAGRLSEKVTVKDSDGSVLVRFAYTRDAAGNPIAIERESGLGVFYYAYDALQRLSYEGQFVSDVRQYENYYEYDPSGNRTLLRHGETDAENLTYYEYDVANELLNLHDVDGWTYFAYDQNGNTVAEQSPAHTRYYDWDGRDMMVGVRSTEQGWTDNELTYDGLAALARLSHSGGTSYFVWDDPGSGLKLMQHPVFGTDMPLDLLIVADGSVSPTRRHVLGRSGLLADDEVAMTDTPSGAVVPIRDATGTVWKTLGADGTLGDSATYDAFGVLRDSSGVLTEWGYASKLRMPAANLLHFAARPYRSPTGSFLSAEPVLRGEGLRYVYAVGKPTRYVDVAGLDAVDVCTARYAALLGKCLSMPFGRERAECLRRYLRLYRICYEENIPWQHKLATAICDWAESTARSNAHRCACLFFAALDFIPVQVGGPVAGLAEWEDCYCGLVQTVADYCRGSRSAPVQFQVTAFDCLTGPFGLVPGVGIPLELISDAIALAIQEAIHGGYGTVLPGLQACACIWQGFETALAHQVSRTVKSIPCEFGRWVEGMEHCLRYNRPPGF